MIRRYPLLFYGILFSFLTIHSQAQERVMVEGRIIDHETQEPVPFVHIINNATGKGVISNTQGRFLISLDQADTLLFSAIGFETYRFTLRENQTSSHRLRVLIEMNTSTMELKPVEIFAYRDEESLKQAIVNMDMPMENLDKSFDLPDIARQPVGRDKQGFGVGIGINTYNFGKRYKEQQKLAKTIQEESYEKLIQAKYNETVVMDLTGLPEDKVEDFMNFCKLDKAFLHDSGPYEIAIAVSKCLKEYERED